MSPAELLMGRRLRSVLTLLKPDLVGSVREKQRKAEESRGVKRNLRDFGIGDPVWVRNFGAGEKWIIGIVQGKMGAVDYIVDLGGNKTAHRHIDQLCKRGVSVFA